MPRRHGWLCHRVPGYARASRLRGEELPTGKTHWSGSPLNLGLILPKAPVRFRAPWQWNGGAAVLQCGATDDTGMVQPTRAAFAAERGLRGVYHYNAIASWRIDEKGASVHARVLDHAWSDGRSQYRARRFCLPSSEQRRHPD